jgi:hypothetical protein
MSALYPERFFALPKPGETISSDGRGGVGITSTCEFLTVPSEDVWESRDVQTDVPVPTHYAPACATGELDDDEFLELLNELSYYAGHLHGGPLYDALYSLAPEDIQGRIPSAAFIVLVDRPRRAVVLEYAPERCAFVIAEGIESPDRYVTFTECWGSDLLRVLRGKLPPSAIGFGRSRTWKAVPGAVRIGLLDLLWTYAHPLRRPDRYLSLYRDLLQLESEPPCRVRAGRANITIEAKGRRLE